jgi:hypothetical protein
MSEFTQVFVRHDNLNSTSVDFIAILAAFRTQKAGIKIDLFPVGELFHPVRAYRVEITN